MKFFVPELPGGSIKNAEELYQSIKKFAEQNGYKVENRRIYSLEFRDYKKTVKAIVDRADPCEGQLVYAILESNVYLICTKNRGVLRGEPMMVGKNEVSAIEEFEE
jgi:hypothetical protein